MIQIAKEYLDGELAKYETWEEMKLTGIFARKLFDNQQAFSAAKRKDKGGVGKETLLKFLGDNWEPWVKILKVYLRTRDNIG